MGFWGDGIPGDVQRGWLSVANERVGCFATGPHPPPSPAKQGKVSHRASLIRVNCADAENLFRIDLFNPSNPAIVSYPPPSPAKQGKVSHSAGLIAVVTRTVKILSI